MPGGMGDVAKERRGGRGNSLRPVAGTFICM
jgi:hypothetical protein